MQYQTLTQIRQRCAEELPGFDPIEHDSILRAWVWDAMRRIDTEKLGEITDGFVTIHNGVGDVPADCLYVKGIDNRHNAYHRYSYSVDSGGRSVRGNPDGKIAIRYYALPLDPDGFPYILDIAEQAILKYIEYKFTALQQKKMQLASNFSFRIDKNLDRVNEQEANTMLAEVRGDLNQLTWEESERLHYFRQQLTTYRN